MATVRALRKDSVSLSSSFLDYFFCCFAGSRGDDRSKSLRRGREYETEEDIADYGSNGESERQPQTTSHSADREDDTDLDEATRRNENDDDDDDAGLDNDALEPHSSTPVSARPTRTHSKSPSRSNKSHESGASDGGSVIEAMHHSPSPHDDDFPESTSSVSRRAGILQFSVLMKPIFHSSVIILPPKS